MAYDIDSAPRNMEEWEILVNTKTQESQKKYEAEVTAAKAQAQAAYANIPDDKDKPTLEEYIAQTLARVEPVKDKKYWEDYYALYYPQEQPEFVEPELTPEQKRQQQISQIDAETSAAIMAGFDYAINGETLHFNYDRDDQTNFEAGAQGCMMRRAGIPGIPDSVTWNGYRQDGSLVRLTLNEEQFIGLYLAGLAHKNACMEAGGARKAELVG